LKSRWERTDELRGRMVFMQEEPPGGGSPACDLARGPGHAPREQEPHGIRSGG